MKKQPLTLYKFNCGFSTKFQPLSPPQFCTYADWKLPRNPQYKLIIYRYCDTMSYYIIVLQSLTRADKTFCSLRSILPEHRMYGEAIIG